MAQDNLKACATCRGKGVWSPYDAMGEPQYERCKSCAGSGKVVDHSGHQPAPDSVWALVIGDMAQRDAMGLRKYGKPLRPQDGRDTLWDAYEEALDLAVYLRKAIAERDCKRTDALPEGWSWVLQDPWGHYAMRTEDGMCIWLEDGVIRGHLAPKYPSIVEMVKRRNADRVDV